MGELRHDVENAVRELRRRYQVHSHELIDDPDASLPPELFHYTSVDGLKGILESRCLWATHFEYLNDSSEVVYGRRLAAEVIQEGMVSCHELTKLMLHDMLDGHQRVYQGTAIYLACMCQDSDLLSQWRSYGSGGGGCAIGLRPRLVVHENKKILPPPQQSGFALAQIVYDADRQRERLRAVIDFVYAHIQQLLNTFKGSFVDDSQLLHFLQVSVGQLLTEMIYLIFQHGYCFKHPKFAEEQEWRLVYLSDEKDVLGKPATSREPATLNVNFRLRHGLLIPYVEIPIHQEDDESLCFDITRIRIGPTSKPDLMQKAIEMMLMKNGVDGVP